MESPKISIVLPIYNIDKYLREGLDSVIGQTYNQLEIVCVDDGSSDFCPDILQEYARKDKRIKVITQENSGTLIARKVGVAEATGDYIMFLDPDDTLGLTAVADVVEKMVHGDYDVIVFGCTFLGESFDNPTIKKYFDKHFNGCLQHYGTLNTRAEILTECFVNHGIPYHQWGKAYRADIVKQAFNLIPDKRCVFAEDQGTALFLFNHASKMAFLNKRLYCYRIGTGISTQSKYTAEKYIASLQSFDMLKSVKAYIANQHENRELLEKIGNDIEVSMVKTAIMFIGRLEEDADINECIESLLHKCPNIPLVKELLTNAKAEEYKTRIDVLTYKNRKHLMQLRIVIAIAAFLLIAVVCLIAL